MILTADSTIAQQTNRRRTGNGWHTTFIGKNRNTLKEGEATPDANIVYPMAFLVEKDAAAILETVAHAAHLLEQIQKVVEPLRAGGASS